MSKEWWDKVSEHASKWRLKKMAEKPAGDPNTPFCGDVIDRFVYGPETWLQKDLRETHWRTKNRWEEI